MQPHKQSLAQRDSTCTDECVRSSRDGEAEPKGKANPCGLAEDLSASAAAQDAAEGSQPGSCAGSCTVLRLLAHTMGGVSVHQAVRDQLMGKAVPQDAAASLAGSGSEDKQTHDVGLRQSSSMTRARNESESCKHVAVLAVGPEGGWTETELALLTEQHAFQTVTTANGRTLDTTTAVISLVSLALDAICIQ